MCKKRTFAFIAVFLIIFLILSTQATLVVDAVYDIEIYGPNGLPKPKFGSLDGEASLRTFIAKYKNIATFIGGLATITMVGAMLYNIGRLNLSVSNPMQRQQCIRGVLVCGILASLLGGSTLFIGLFYGLFL